MKPMLMMRNDRREITIPIYSSRSPNFDAIHASLHPIQTFGPCISQNYATDSIGISISALTPACTMMEISLLGPNTFFPSSPNTQPYCRNTLLASPKDLSLHDQDMPATWLTQRPSIRPISRTTLSPLAEKCLGGPPAFHVSGLIMSA